MVGAIRRDTHSPVNPQSKPTEHQNVSLNANWMFRGVMALVTIPKVLSVTPVSIPLKDGWLRTLKNSARNWYFNRSVIGPFFSKAKSRLSIPGPSMALGATVPESVEAVGGEKHEVLKNWVIERLPR